MHFQTILLVASLATYSAAYFRMSCPGRITRERLDPIVNPGSLAGHVHTVSGGSGFKASMAFQDARASLCSSCTIKEDLSNYWTPTLYVRFKNGTFAAVPVIGDPADTNGGMAVYYLQRRGNNNSEPLHAFPEGFRMLAGDPLKRNLTTDLAAQGISFACLGANKPETNGFPNYQCPGGLRAQVFFPACWNGKDLDTPDHRSHMSYPAGQNYNTGPCPAAFPVHMISIFFEVLYDTARYNDQWNGDQHPFVFSNGDATGYGFHGDFLNGWDVGVLQTAIDTCNDGSGSVEACAAVTQYTATECNQCKILPSVNERVSGVLQSLPGCNDVTTGPGRAPPAPASCANNPTPSGTPARTDFVDVTSTKKWFYVGCGIDSVGDRALKAASKATDSMTVEMCIDFCAAANQTFAALEYGRECYCGMSISSNYSPRQGFLGSCTMKCAGNNAETCGDAARISLYRKCTESSCSNRDYRDPAVLTKREDLNAGGLRIEGRKWKGRRWRNVD